MIYIDLYNALKELIKNSGSDFRHIDWFNRQYENTEEENAVRYPAVFIDFSERITWQEDSEKMQSATMSFNLHFVGKTLSENSEGIMQTAHAVTKYISGQRLIKGNNQLTTEIVRTTTEIVTRSTKLKVFKVGFKTEVYDINLMDDTTQIASGTVGFTIV